jgi:hypothetical protein
VTRVPRLHAGDEGVLNGHEGVYARPVWNSEGALDQVATVFGASAAEADRRAEVLAAAPELLQLLERLARAVGELPARVQTGDSVLAHRAAVELLRRLGTNL